MFQQTHLAYWHGQQPFYPRSYVCSCFGLFYYYTVCTFWHFVWFITEQQITSYNGPTVWLKKKWNFALGSVCINSCGVILKCLDSDHTHAHTHTQIFVAHCCCTKLVQELTNLQLPKSTTLVTISQWGEPFLFCVWRQPMNV
jgi:hypothetical protein